MRKTEGSDLQYKFACSYITTVSYIYKPKKLNTLNGRLFIEENTGRSFLLLCTWVCLTVCIFDIHIHQDDQLQSIDEF